MAIDLLNIWLFIDTFFFPMELDHLRQDRLLSSALPFGGIQTFSFKYLFNFSILISVFLGSFIGQIS